MLQRFKRYRRRVRSGEVDAIGYGVVLPVVEGVVLTVVLVVTAIANVVSRFLN